MGFRFLTALTAAALCAGAAYATDDIQATIDGLVDNANVAATNAATALQNGDYGTAANEFEFAAQYTNQLKAYQIVSYLAPAPDGWTTENLEVTTAAAAMFGGGSSIEQDYVNANEVATIRILADSPLLQSFSMMLSNPMLMMSSNNGQQTVMINGKRAMMEPQGDGVQISFPHNGYLIQGEGDQDQVVSLIEGINFQGLDGLQ